MSLTGGLGADLTPEALVGRDPKEIARIVLDGVPDSAMPPWRPLLSEEEAARIANYLLHGDPRVQALHARGVIRRIAAAPNHYVLGLVANGMTVWDVEDEAVSTLGPQVGALPFVSQSYRRPRALPLWPYNFFAMVHGQTGDKVESKRAQIATLLGAASRRSDILYSIRILKKTGLRLRKKEG